MVRCERWWILKKICDFIIGSEMACFSVHSAILLKRVTENYKFTARNRGVLPKRGESLHYFRSSDLNLALFSENVQVRNCSCVFHTPRDKCQPCRKITPHFPHQKLVFKIDTFSFLSQSFPVFWYWDQLHLRAIDAERFARVTSCVVQRRSVPGNHDAYTTQKL